MKENEQKPIKITAELSARLEAAMEYVKNNFRKAPHLPEMAKVAKASTFHFHRAFKQHFGVTPKAIITKLQVEEAQRLMKDGVSAQKVWKEVGFAHQSHFSCRFKQMVGIPPVRWLRQTKAMPIAPNPNLIVDGQQRPVTTSAEKP